MSSNQDKSINFQSQKPRFFNKKKDGEPAGGGQFAFRSKKADKNSDSSSSRQYGNDENQAKSTGSHVSGLNVKAKPFSKADLQRNSMGAPSSQPFKPDNGDQCKSLRADRSIHRFICFSTFSCRSIFKLTKLTFCSVHDIIYPLNTLNSSDNLFLRRPQKDPNIVVGAAPPRRGRHRHRRARASGGLADANSDARRW